MQEVNSRVPEVDEQIEEHTGQPNEQQSPGESDLATAESELSLETEAQESGEAESETDAESVVSEFAVDGEPGPEDDAEPPIAEETIEADDLLGDTPPGDTADQDEKTRLRAVIEAVIYITEEPLTEQQICAAIGQSKEVVREILAELVDEFEKPSHGLAIREIAGGYKMATKAEHHDAVRAFVRSLKPPLKLSLAALETLAVVAYKQPITAPEIMEIRGVQGASVLKTLLDRKLIAAAGRKNVIGKPVLYKTTKEFLVQFGLKDLAELPTLKEFEEIRRMSIPDAEGVPEAAAAPSSTSMEPDSPTFPSGDIAESEIAESEAVASGEPAAEEITAEADAVEPDAEAVEPADDEEPKSQGSDA